jgi:hypothetical protein
MDITRRHAAIRKVAAVRALLGRRQSQWVTTDSNTPATAAAIRGLMDEAINSVGSVATSFCLCRLGRFGQLADPLTDAATGQGVGKGVQTGRLADRLASGNNVIERREAAADDGPTRTTA